MRLPLTCYRCRLRLPGRWLELKENRTDPWSIAPGPRPLRLDGEHQALAQRPPLANRYFSCPLSESHLRRVLAYVERNPVRAGLVAQAERYEWSSAAIHLGLLPDRLQLSDLAFWQAQGGAVAWRTLLMTPDEAITLRLLRRCTYAGRPFGDDEFVESLEDRFRRSWRRWGFESDSATAAS